MKQTIDELYLKSEDIQNLQQTVSDLIDRLMTETRNNGKDDRYTQLVIQLNPDINYGKEWKIFVYANPDNGTYTYSYQDQDMWDSMFYRSNPREFMLAKVLEEAKSVGGVQWVALDF